MLDFHEGKRLEYLVDKMIKKGRRSGAVKRFADKIGISTHSGLRYHYNQQRLKPVLLQSAINALGITEDLFYERDSKPLKIDKAPQPEGLSLLHLIEQRGIEKSWLASQLGVSRPTLDRYGKAVKLPGEVKDKLMAMYNLPGDFFTDPRPLDSIGFRELQGQLTAMQQSLATIERLIREKF